MKKIKYFVFATCFTMAFTACDDLLDVEDYTKQNTSNFPATTNDVANELGALYGVMGEINNFPLETPYYIDELMSDNAYGGGQCDADAEPKAIHHLVTCNAEQYAHLWNRSYAGIARANAIISTIDNVDWNGDTKSRDQALGEAFFMRGYYYMGLTQHFGNVPLVVSTTVTDTKDANAEEHIWPQILSDFVSAKNLMNKKIDGHANKFAAEGFLARAYMFYEGFYKEVGEMAKATPSAVELVAQEGVQEGQTLSKDDVTNALKDIVTNGGYVLLPEFRSLWQYSNRITQKDYPATQDLPEGQCFQNGNAEEIFQVRFGNATTYDGNPQSSYTLAYTNYVSLYYGLRCDSDADGNVNGENGTFPFGQGWGQGSASQQLWDDWVNNEPTDKRRGWSLIDCVNELPKYAFTKSCAEETGYVNKKYISVTALSSFDGTKTQDWGQSDDYTWWCFEAGWPGKNGANSMQECHFEDFYLLRYADVLLMLTELTGDASYMNQVRARVGLANKEYSWQNIKNERRWELCFEGLRFQDLRRWSGINATETSEICKALQAQDGTNIHVSLHTQAMKHVTSSWSARYLATKGFLPKPAKQMNLSNGDMEQNPGWDTSDAQYKALYTKD